MQNITNIYGKKGQEWFDNLPKIVNALSNYWQLTDVIPVDNMTYNYVVKATTQGKSACGT